MDGSPWHLTRPSLLTLKPLGESVSAGYGWMALVPHPSILVDPKASGRVGCSFSIPPEGMRKEEYEEWMSIDEDIPVAATLTDSEICQAVSEQDQAIKVDDYDWDECVEKNISNERRNEAST
ncbi:hypothetical protein AVEN_92701-1 [Araneus ventricosus]|uniref:Uncharacterized protein n=1 Tax=Araneus ventricosus TaxID=182803 RepID=A0A4Y2HM04_ARAVE|nr:hypothetical protein AVEN_92701-1 [Araneus ventricosus]